MTLREQKNIKNVCKSSPYTAMRINVKQKKICYYIWIKNNTQNAAQYILVSKLVFSSEPQDRKSNDQQALGAEDFLTIPMTNITLYLLKT
jgi:hypothetical protein